MPHFAAVDWDRRVGAHTPSHAKQTLISAPSHHKFDATLGYPVAVAQRARLTARRTRSAQDPSCDCLWSSLAIEKRTFPPVSATAWMRHGEHECRRNGGLRCAYASAANGCPSRDALDLQLDRLEDLHATLEAHEKEDVLEMTWPKQKPPARESPDASHGATPSCAPRATAASGGAVGPRHDPACARPAGGLGTCATLFAKEVARRRQGAIRRGRSQVAAPTVLGPRATAANGRSLGDAGLGARASPVASAIRGAWAGPTARADGSSGSTASGGRAAEEPGGGSSQCVRAARRLFASFLSDGAAVPSSGLAERNRRRHGSAGERSVKF